MANEVVADFASVLDAQLQDRVTVILGVQLPPRLGKAALRAEMATLARGFWQISSTAVRLPALRALIRRSLRVG